MNIFVDAKTTDDARRKDLYEGSVFVQSPSPYARKLCQLAKDMIEEAFHPLDPLTLHETMPVERCVEKLSILKPQFIHHAKSKEYIQGWRKQAATLKKHILMCRAFAQPFRVTT